jgi:hypothetical protein
MLSLKIIHTDINGGRTTHLFSGERISHIEEESTNHTLDYFSEHPYYFMVGQLTQSSSTQPYVKSVVTVFDGNDLQEILILPLSECYIMADGKTIDTFSSYFK